MSKTVGWIRMSLRMALPIVIPLAVLLVMHLLSISSAHLMKMVGNKTWNFFSEFTDKIQNAWLSQIILEILVFFLLYFLFRKVLKRDDFIVSGSEYILAPYWLLLLGMKVTDKKRLEAKSVPIWMHAKLLSRSDITVDEPSFPEINGKVSCKVLKDVGDDGKCTLIINDQFRSSNKKIPKELKESGIISILGSSSETFSRSFNRAIIDKTSMVVHRLEKKNNITHFTLLIFANPQIVSVLFRDCFQDPNQVPKIHLTIYDSPAKNGYEFKKPHRIF